MLARDWVMQFEGSSLENLARTVADRIFLNKQNTWHGEYAGEAKPLVYEVVNAAVTRARFMGDWAANRHRAKDVLKSWGVADASSDEEISGNV
jgi:hypothetical protein